MERSVLIAIPAYNEEANIASVIKKASNFGDVYVFNNNSDDQTKEISEENNASILLVKDQGYENVIFAIVEFFLSSNFLKLVILDGDGEVGLDKMNDGIELLDEYDAVIGNRNSKKRLAERIVCFLFDYFYNIKDIYCGFKCFKKRGISASRKQNTFATSIVQKDSKILNIPVKVNKRLSQSKLGEGISINMQLLSAGIQ